MPEIGRQDISGKIEKKSGYSGGGPASGMKPPVKAPSGAVKPNSSSGGASAVTGKKK